MSKKVLILSSSPRRGGNSDTLCDEFMRGATEAGNEVKKVFLRDRPSTIVRDAVYAANIRSRALRKMMRRKLLRKCYRPMLSF